MKKCSCCGIEKEPHDFQVRKASKDGLTSSCKSCLRIRDSRRYQWEKEKRSASSKKYLKTEAGKKSHADSCAKWSKRNSIRRAAQVILGNALRDGKIKKLPCFVCGDEDVQGHHPNYDAPIDVVWLCVKHHNELHLQARKFCV